jgi:phospholipid/cholesterol/gamma-HCH transport system permease protein
MSTIDKQKDYREIKPPRNKNSSLEDVNKILHNLKHNSQNLKKILVDLSDCDEEDYLLLTFMIALGKLVDAQKINIELKNLDNQKLQKKLQTLGFDTLNSFKPKNFKTHQQQSFTENLGDASIAVLIDAKKLVGFTGSITQAFFYLIKNPSKINVREVLFYMDKSGANAVPIVLMICFLMGVILAFQGIAQLGRFGLEVYTADLVALGLVRELGPLMVGMICIGRAGSAYAAELGTMKVAEEIDAMNTMGIKPERFLVVPKIVALIIVMPMLVILGDIAGIFGGILIGITMTNISFLEYFNRTLSSLIPANILETIIKAIVFAIIIAAIGCFKGFESDNDAKGVGKATTSSVVAGIFLIVIMDFFVTFTYPQFLELFGVSY